jgi:hypothetical protein
LYNRVKVRRRLVAVGSVALFAACSQGQEAAKSLFDTVRPDLTVYVRRHSLGADLVQVVPTDARYDPAQLRSELEALGNALGSPTRGVQVYARELSPGNPNLRVVTASGAVDGLTNDRGGVAFPSLVSAFGPNPKVEGLALILEGFRVGPDTLRSYQGKGFALEGRVFEEPPLVEYRIRILSRDPKDWTLATAPAPSQTKPSGGERDDRNLLLGLLALAGVGAGALVYSLVLRRAPSQ